MSSDLTGRERKVFFAVVEQGAVFVNRSPQTTRRQALDFIVLQSLRRHGLVTWRSRDYHDEPIVLTQKGRDVHRYLKHERG